VIERRKASGLIANHMIDRDDGDDDGGPHPWRKHVLNRGFVASSLAA